MSSGVLLPGTAAASDVNSGKTFSSSAGFNITGSALVALPGTIGLPIFPSGFGVENNTSVAVNLPSGCPILVAIWSVTGSIAASGIADNFATSYTWSRIDAQSAGDSNSRTELWQGTKGAGASGTITVSGLSGDYCVCAIPVPACPLGTNTIVDVHGHNSGDSTSASLSLTPTNTGEAAVFLIGQYYASHALNWSVSGSPAATAWSHFFVPTHQLADQWDCTSALAITQVAGSSAIEPVYTFDTGATVQWTVVGAILLNS